MSTQLQEQLRNIPLSCAQFHATGLRFCQVPRNINNDVFSSFQISIFNVFNVTLLKYLIYRVDYFKLKIILKMLEMCSKLTSFQLFRKNRSIHFWKKTIFL